MPALALRLLSVLALLVVEQAQAADVVVHASRQGEVLEVEASAEFEADLRQSWQVLTDYDHLAEFIPGMHVSRTLLRTGNGVMVEQKGEARLLFFSYPIEVKLAVEEFPYERIISRAVAGDFREMRGAYHLEARKGRITLRYRGRMAPDFIVPPLIGVFVLRKNVEKQFGALVDEILRRQRPGPQSGPSCPDVNGLLNGCDRAAAGVEGFPCLRVEHGRHDLQRVIIGSHASGAGFIYEFADDEALRSRPPAGGGRRDFDGANRFEKYFEMA